jgi:hypothetical protein
MSKTSDALFVLSRHPEFTPYAAARAVGAQPSSVYRALKRARCPSCGQTLKKIAKIAHVV